MYQNLYQIVSFLKQSSDFLISAKGNIYPSNNPWLRASGIYTPGVLEFDLDLDELWKEEYLGPNGNKRI